MLEGKKGKKKVMFKIGEEKTRKEKCVKMREELKKLVREEVKLG